jgi:hypothetical protein
MWEIIFGLYILIGLGLAIATIYVGIKKDGWSALSVLTALALLLFMPILWPLAILLVAFDRD